MQIDLTGKVALVTGSSQGIGEAIARLLHGCGASVVINYFEEGGGENRAKAETVVSSLGERAIALAADVRRSEEASGLIDLTVEKWGQLDILVNNAGILRDRSLKKMTPTDWNDVIDTNLSGVFHVSQAAALRMNDGGRIVSMASLAAVVGFFGQANYASAKAGVIAFTKVLSKEVARRGITANAVAPGVVLTDMGKKIPEEHRAEMIGHIPLGRFAEPQEIANVVLFLASDLASYVTGQTIHVNGGWWG